MIWNSLGFLVLGVCFLPQGSFQLLFQVTFPPPFFLFSPFETPIMWMLICFVFPHKSLKLSECQSLLFISGYFGKLPKLRNKVKATWICSSNLTTKVTYDFKDLLSCYYNPFQTIAITMIREPTEQGGFFLICYHTIRFTRKATEECLAFMLQICKSASVIWGLKEESGHHPNPEVTPYKNGTAPWRERSGVTPVSCAPQTRGRVPPLHFSLHSWFRLARK